MKERLNDVRKALRGIYNMCGEDPIKEVSVPHEAKHNIKKAADFLKKNKTKIGVGIGIVVGNTLAGGVLYDQNKRIGQLEQRAGSNEILIADLISEDVRDKRAICNTIGEVMVSEGYPLDEEMIAGMCDQIAGEQAWKWAERVRDAEGK